MSITITSVSILTLVVFLAGGSERRFRQSGSSAMSPTIQPNENVVADMSAFRKSGPQRWDVVVFHPPPKETLTQPQNVWVMRVIGLPGEGLEIRDDGIYIDGRRETQPKHIASIRYTASVPGSPQSAVIYPYKIAADTYFLVGDNTTNSFDSRFWGSLSRQSILGKVKDNPAASDAPKLVGFSLRWVHPRLSASQPVRVNDAAAAMRLASVFEEYDRPLKGTPYDCPLYDVVVTLHRQDGASTDLKVYLPRARVFPGMWKHPGGTLNYFEAEKSQQTVLVEILRPYIPVSPVYPTAMATWPPVNFNKGIPDFREVDYPISGSSEEFHKGQR
jgi:signal peptidase I